MNNVSAGFQQTTVSRTDAANYLGVSISTLARWGSNGEGPPYYVIGAKARYRITELDEYIEQCKMHRAV